MALTWLLPGAIQISPPPPPFPALSLFYCLNFQRRQGPNRGPLSPSAEQTTPPWDPSVSLVTCQLRIQCKIQLQLKKIQVLFPILWPGRSPHERSCTEFCWWTWLQKCLQDGHSEWCPHFPEEDRVIFGEEGWHIWHCGQWIWHVRSRNLWLRILVASSPLYGFPSVYGGKETGISISD